jgi:hypothetical protein
LRGLGEGGRRQRDEEGGGGESQEHVRSLARGCGCSADICLHCTRAGIGEFHGYPRA